MERLSTSVFTYDLWGAGSLTLLNVETREYSIKANRSLIAKYAIGYADGSKLNFRPKEDTVAVMFYCEDTTFWTHLTKKEFGICFPDQEIY